jgi:hypothetical protein
VSDGLEDRQPRPPLTIRAGARPFEISVMSGGFIAGMMGLLNLSTRSSVIERAFPGWWAAAWYCSLILWCGLALYAVIPQAAHAIRQGWSFLVHPHGQGRLMMRLRLEQAGMIGFSGSVFAYGIAAVAYAGPAATTAAIWIGLFGVASLWRATEIHLDLRKLDRARADPHPAYPVPLGDPRGAQR